MKKRITAIALAAALLLSLTGCSSKVFNDYVSVAKYKGLEIAAVEEKEVTDEDVEDYIETELNADAAEVEITDRAAEDGDWVNIDYTGSVDGEEFDGGSSEDYGLELGSGTFIGAEGDYEGFEDQIIGHETGDEFDITVQFAEDYSEESLQGEVAVFHIVLNYIYEKNVPSFTDEWVIDNTRTGSTTTEEYEEEVRERIQAIYDEDTQEEIYDELEDALMEQVTIKSYPDGAVEQKVEQAEAYYTYMALQMGMDLDEMIESMYSMSETEFYDKLESGCQKAVALEQVISLIAEKQNLTPTDEEYEERIAEIVADAGCEDIEEYAATSGADVDDTEEMLKANIRQDVVFAYLLKHCKQVESEE